MTKVPPWVVVSMQTDGALGERDKVVDADRMWPTVTAEMARARDFTKYNSKRARTGAQSSATSQLNVAASSLPVARTGRAGGALSEASMERVADSLEEWYAATRHPTNRNPPAEIVQRHVYQVLSSLSEAERTASVRKVIAADQKEIGLRTIAAANKAVRLRLGTFCPRPGRQRKGGGPPGAGASRANVSSQPVGQAERLEPAEQQQSADQR